MTKIILTPQVQVKLAAWAEATNGLEFSGLGMVERIGSEFTVTDVDLLGVGSGGFTIFPYERARQLGADPGRKLWFHRHPILGWSGTDETTATKTPLGGIPELVQWSLAIVLTPHGWIGRLDFHVPKPRTIHCPVEPALFSDDVQAAAKSLLTEELQGLVAELRAEYARQMQELDGPRRVVYTEFDCLDDGMDDDLYVDALFACGCQVEQVLESAVPEHCLIHTWGELDDYWYVDAPADGGLPWLGEETLYGQPRAARHTAGWRQSFSKWLGGRS